MSLFPKIFNLFNQIVQLQNKFYSWGVYFSNSIGEKWSEMTLLFKCQCGDAYSATSQYQLGIVRSLSIWTSVCPRVWSWMEYGRNHGNFFRSKKPQKITPPSTLGLPLLSDCSTHISSTEISLNGRVKNSSTNTLLNDQKNIVRQQKKKEQLVMWTNEWKNAKKNYKFSLLLWTETVIFGNY